MTKFFYTTKSTAGTTRFNSGIVRHRNHVCRVFDEPLVKEVKASGQFIEITAEAFNAISRGLEPFTPARHLFKEEPKKEVKVEEPAKAEKPEAKPEVKKTTSYKKRGK